MKAITVQLKKELENIGKKSLKTLFIGGGTPSCVKAFEYENFFETVRDYLKEDAEITVEANPNGVSSEWLLEMRNFGVNRISFGVQSFFDDKLKFLGRTHDGKTAKRAVFLAKDAGFSHINIDLIYSTVFDTKERIEKEVEEAFSLPIDHISGYALTLEEGTSFWGREDVKREGEEEAIFFAERIKERGFTQYEVSNFGFYKSKHNLGYWAGEEYIGIGAGAVGFRDGCRYYPKTDIKEYIKNPLFRRIERLSKEDIKTERVFLGLRCELGVDLGVLNEKERERVYELEKEGKVFIREGRFFGSDLFLADEIALYVL